MFGHHSHPLEFGSNFIMPIYYAIMSIYVCIIESMLIIIVQSEMLIAIDRFSYNSILLAENTIFNA
jgi:hypothetical protein